MKNSLNIKAFCSIKNNTISYNGKPVVELDNSLLFNDFSKQVYKEHINNYPKFFKMDSASKLSFLTAEFLLNNANISSEEKENMGIILSNNSASLNTDRKHQETINDTENYFPSPAIFVYTLPNIGIGEISIRHKIYGENAFFVFEKFNAKILFQYSTTLFNSNKSNTVLCGWVNVDQDKYEAFMYLVGTQGNYEHTLENIDKLHKK